jgi:plastocyanin
MSMHPQYENTGVRELQRYALLLPAFLMIIVLLAGRSGSQSRPAASDAPTAGAAIQIIEIKQIKFLPAVVTVHPGDKIQWTNNDIVPHTATTVDKGFDSGSIGVGETWTLTAPSKKGDYFYTCTFHPNMKAKLVVE